MKRKIFAVAAALGLLAGTGAFAQDRSARMNPGEQRSPEQMAQRMTQRMTDELGLDKSQADEVYELNLDQIRQMQALRERMRTTRQAEVEKMKTILSAEQFEKWSQMQGPRPGGPRHDMHRGGCQEKNGCKNKSCCKEGAQGRKCDGKRP